MMTRKFALTALVPVAVAGITVSSWAAVDAASHPSGSHALQHQVVRAPRPGGRTARRGAHAGGKARAGSASWLRAGLNALAKADSKAHRTAVHHHAQAKPAATAAQPAGSSSSLLAGMSAFEQCVAFRESSDNPTASSAGLFGILPSTWASLGYPGTAGQASVAMQKAAFSKLYAEEGTAPWAQYDGC